MKALRNAVTASVFVIAAAHIPSASAQLLGNGFGSQLQAGGCRQSSYIPSMSPLAIRNDQGTAIAFERSVRHGMPTVRVWVNGQFSGEHNVPFSAYGGQIQTRLRQQMRLETWLGSVRQAMKPVPYLVVCGDWFGDLP